MVCKVHAEEKIVLNLGDFAQTLVVFSIFLISLGG